MLLSAFALCATILTVYGAGYLMTSNSVTINPTAQFTLTLSPDTSTPVVGDTVTLTATCNDNTFNGDVTFSSLGTRTAVAGVATITFVPTSTTPVTITASATHP